MSSLRILSRRLLPVVLRFSFPLFLVGVRLLRLFRGCGCFRSSLQISHKFYSYLALCSSCVCFFRLYRLAGQTSWLLWSFVFASLLSGAGELMKSYGRINLINMECMLKKSMSDRRAAAVELIESGIYILRSHSECPIQTIYTNETEDTKRSRRHEILNVNRPRQNKSDILDFYEFSIVFARSQMQCS